MKPPRLPLSLRVLGGRLGAQWERDRRDTLFLMVPVLLAALPHLRSLPWWVGTGFLILFGWRLGLLLSGRWLPRASVRWAGAIAAVAAVGAHYQTLIGREPGVALLVLFLGLKLMEVNARRDLFVVIFLSLFLLLAAFLHSQSIVTATLVMLALAGLLAAMLTMQYLRHEAPIRQRLRLVGTLIFHALPVAAILFVLFPRPGGPLWGLPGDASRASTGLSDSMTPGAISELGESREIAFRVQFDGTPPAPAALYWRGPSFGEFDGTTWRALPPAVAAQPAPALSVARDQRIAYTVTQEPSGRPWLFALEMPVRVSAPPGIVAAMLPDMQLVTRQPLGERIRFSVESALVWQAGIDETPASLAPLRELPIGFNPRTHALARQWLESGPAGGEAPMRLVERALAMFREQPFHYTLQPPRLGRHSVDDFLFDTRSGFCEHYAGAFVVLMRALGIPARVVTGYQGGERNPVDGWWLVRQADAHAWAEVWLEDRGWLRVDPTAAVAPERIERGVRLQARLGALPGLDAAVPLFERLRFNLDALTNAWNQWLLSYDRTRQQRLLERFGLQVDDWRGLAAAIALALTVALGGIAVLTLHPRRKRDPVERAWDEFCERMAATGLARRPHETASSYLRRVERLVEPERLGEARRIVATYNRLRYGVEPDSPTYTREARTLLRCARQFRP